MEIEIFYALLASIIWGGMFALSKNVKANQLFQNVYITFGGFVVALSVFVLKGAALESSIVLAGLASGALWALASLSFLYSMKHMGIGRSLPISVSGQILVSLLWGIFLFGEFLSSGMINTLFAISAVMLICTGSFFISKTKENMNAENLKKGLGLAVLSSVFWGTQFVPIKLVSADSFAVMLPLATGMLITALVAALVKFGKNIEIFFQGKERNLLNGFMWAAGNYLSLFAVAAIGLTKGYVLSQVGVVVIPILLGAFYFKEIKERKSYLFLFVAVAVIIAGSVVLSIAKS